MCLIRKWAQVCCTSRTPRKHTSFNWFPKHTSFNWFLHCKITCQLGRLFINLKRFLLDYARKGYRGPSKLI
uniref:Putative ovule protein n=1 Tax=Solanum chacoense TaxID=4108 RepID=A0A0V0H7Y2_SOLCH